MPTITTTDGTEIFYKDWGSGQPIVFSHGWPLSSDDWDTQLMFFLDHGYRVVASDRRGHGRSAQVPDGHDMDHYTDSGPLSAKLLKNGTLKTYQGFPHGMPTTEAATINANLLAFIRG
jgi:pimeloyl-ACP methyl ester carboxylesterase